MEEAETLQVPHVNRPQVQIQVSEVGVGGSA